MFIYPSSASIRILARLKVERVMQWRVSQTLIRVTTSTVRQIKSPCVLLAFMNNIHVPQHMQVKGCWGPVIAAAIFANPQPQPIGHQVSNISGVPTVVQTCKVFHSNVRLRSESCTFQPTHNLPLHKLLKSLRILPILIQHSSSRIASGVTSYIYRYRIKSRNTLYV
jgi:hypothetical protein